MRDKNRIREFLNDLADRWEDDVIAYWRFGQLMSNFNDWLMYHGRDWFYMEEGRFMEYFDKYLEGIKNGGN